MTFLLFLSCLKRLIMPLVCMISYYMDSQTNILSPENATSSFNTKPFHISLFPPFSSLLIYYSGPLLSISSCLWAVWWPEPHSGDCLCSSMWRSHFRSPMTIPGGTAPPWLMLYKTIFTVVTFQRKQAGSELSICWFCPPVPPSSFVTISPSLTYLLFFPLILCLLTPFFPPVLYSIFHLSFFPLFVFLSSPQFYMCVTHEQEIRKTNRDKNKYKHIGI